MNLKLIMKKLFNFDEFMRIYVIMFKIAFVVGFIGNLRKISKYGVLLYFIMMIGILIGGVVFLKVYQWLGQKIGFDQTYYKTKGKIK